MVLLPEIKVEEDKPVEDKSTEPVADKSVDTGKIESAKEPEPDKVDAEPETAEEPEKDSFGDRIKELTDKVRTNKQTSDAQLFEERAENERLRKELESRPAVQEAAKTLEDFEFDESKYRTYLDERTHEIATKAGEEAGSKFQTQATAQQIQSSFRTKEAEFEAQTKDYASVVYGEVNGQRSWQASTTMADEIRLSDIGPQLGYHLAKNPDLAAEISALSHDESVRRMTLLASNLKAEMSKKPKEVSDAPPPVPQIKSGDAGMSKGIDDPDLSDAAYAKMRRKQIENR